MRNAKHLAYFLILSSATGVLSGCVSAEKTAQTEMGNVQVEQSASGEKKGTEIPVVSPLMRMNENARKNIKEATDKQNARLSEIMADIDTTYAERYSGAVIKTDMGDITVKLYGEESPLTVSNFLQLAEKGIYDGTKFHRVIRDFMIQGGDPNSKDDDPSNDGQGGPGYKFKDEFNERKLVKGSLAMANSGPNTNGSQFFIVTKDSTPWLDGKHTNFGEVTAGMDVVEALGVVPTSGPPTDRPLKDVSIKGVTLIKK